MTKMMRNVNGYSYDAIKNTLTITKAFSKKASVLNSPEYRILLQLRKDNPGMQINLAEKQESSNQATRLTYKQMEAFIDQCADADERLATFEKIKSLSKVQNSPYMFVRDWFLNNYANYAEQPVFDEDGFVIVKTKAQMEAEKKAAAEHEARLKEAVEKAVAALVQQSETVAEMDDAEDYDLPLAAGL